MLPQLELGVNKRFGPGLSGARFSASACLVQVQHRLLCVVAGDKDVDDKTCTQDAGIQPKVPGEQRVAYACSESFHRKLIDDGRTRRHVQVSRSMW